jgi:hypothetical protein
MHTCNYCTRPAHTQINNQIYCGKLCAAMELIAEAHAEHEITRDNIGIWAEQIIESMDKRMEAQAKMIEAMGLNEETAQRLIQ